MESVKGLVRAGALVLGLFGMLSPIAGPVAAAERPGASLQWRDATPLQTPEDADSLLAASSGNWAAPQCIGDGVSGPRVQPVYVYRTWHRNRFGQFQKILQRSTYLTTGIFERSSDGLRTVRWVHDAACQPVFWQVSVPASKTYYLTTIRKYLKRHDARFRDPNRVYSLWVDARTSPSWSGLGDDRWSGVWSSSYGFIWVDAHELVHALGAVSVRAPHSTGRAHCNDEHDVMCYNDGGRWRKRLVCPDPQAEYRLDCGKDDYFAVNPRRGSWLARHPRANVANSRFLAKVSPRVLPTRPLRPTGVVRTAERFSWQAQPGLRYDVGYFDDDGALVWLGQDLIAGEVGTVGVSPDARLFVRAVNDAGYSKRTYEPDGY